MRLLQLFLLLDQNRRCGVWRYRRLSIRRKCSLVFAICESTFDQFNEHSMVNVAGCSDHKIAWRELSRMKCCRDFLIESRHSFRGTFDRTAERMFGKICGVEKLSQEFVGCVLDHF